MSLHSMLTQRFRNSPDVLANVVYLSSDQGREVMLRIVAHRQSNEMTNALVLDISSVSQAEVRKVLSPMRDATEVVWLIWVQYLSGVMVRYDEFVNYYDDFWYPSSDDLWITNSAVTFLIEISHEEMLTAVPVL